MSKAGILNREVEEAKGSNKFNQPKVDPFHIYGFREELEAALKDKRPFRVPSHPEFPNPRTELTDKSEEIVQNIVDTKQVRTAINGFWKEEGGKKVFVVTSGFTRMTGVGEAMRQNPNDKTLFPTVDYIPHVDTEDNIRAHMATDNYDRENISDIMLAKHLLFLKQNGVSEEELVKVTGREPRSGIRWVREMLALVEEEELTEEVLKGDIDQVTAKAIATQAEDEAEQEVEEETPAAPKAEKKKAVAAKKTEKVKEKVTAVKKGKASGKSTKQAAKDAGIRRSNKGTMTYPEAAAELVKIYPKVKVAAKADRQEPTVEEWGDQPTREDYLNDLQTLEQYFMFVLFLKIPGRSLYDQFLYIETNILNDEQKGEVISWMPAQGKAAAEETAEKAEAAAPKATGKKK